MRSLSAALLLACAVSAQDDPRIARFKTFFDTSVRGQWAKEEFSEARKVTVRDFAKHDVPDAARWLMLEVIPKDEGADVVREAVRVLTKYKSPVTIQAMAETWMSKYKRNVDARALGILAFSRTNNEYADGPLVHALTKEKDPRVIAAACRAVGAGRKTVYVPNLGPLLKHKHPVVRGAAALAFAELRTGEAMPAIFHRFCTDPSARARYDCWIALKKLSLKKFGTDPKEWEGWWEEQKGADGDAWGASFPRPAKGASDKALFFRIPVGGDRIVFVLDSSLHMNNLFKVDIPAQRKLPKPDRIPGFFSVKTRWDLMRNWTNTCLGGLPDKTGVGFLFYNHEMMPYPDTGKLLKLNKSVRGKVAGHMQEEVNRGGTKALYEALSGAWGFLKGGDPNTNFKKGADTIVFVTCGSPTAGKLKNRADRLADECWKIAMTRGVRFHTVGLHNHAFALMTAVAKDSGGLYVHAQQAGDPAEPQDLDFWPEKKKAFEAARKKKKRRK
ncbi:MAG: HEAT repeat domain-containing protein [Planctomycetota bacterium]|jgi:hypothetical protein